MTTLERIHEIANAVLYEGYLLYPYGRTAIKNQRRWTFGVLYPREYSEAQGATEPWQMQTQCLVLGSPTTELDITARFLQLLQHSAAPAARASDPAQPASEVWDVWEEGYEREVQASAQTLGDLGTQPRQVAISFIGGRLPAAPAPSSGAARVDDILEQQSLAGSVTLAAEALDVAEASEQTLYRVTVRIENTTPQTRTITSRREAILPHSLISTHTILQVRGGTFVSLLEPPDAFQAAAQSCRNLHTWPVLVGDAGACDALLSSPIILYDYPQIAPESPGPLFDGCEIDEILSLRILTLSDEEKAEMREGDERAREILERTEALTSEQFMKMHGVIRNLRPVDSGERA